MHRNENGYFQVISLNRTCQKSFDCKDAVCNSRDDDEISSIKKRHGTTLQSKSLGSLCD